MTYGVVVRKAAEGDIRDAYLYYESCRQGLGKEFMLSLDAAMARIARSPAHFRVVYNDIRRLSIQRFPYGVLFLLDEEKVIVLAVMHARRDPSEWQLRQ
jgi:toxin ParE1/3/4